MGIYGEIAMSEYRIFDPISTNISKKRFKTKEEAQKRINRLISAGNTEANDYRVI